MSGPVRVGSGYDAHRFGTLAGSVVLCGVGIDFDRVVEATSDGDVAAHALADALLGAAGLGDIGALFPSSDDRWNDAASLDTFVGEIVSRLDDQGYRVGNADITIVAERLRIAPHRAEMRSRVAEVLGVAEADVSIKATSTDGLGFVGRDEGLAAMATVSLLRAQ